MLIFCSLKPEIACMLKVTGHHFTEAEAAYVEDTLLIMMQL